MKRFMICLVLFGMAIGAGMTALALPPLPIYVEEHYRASPQYAKFAEKYQGLEMDNKCDACHKPGADKKAKGHALNDFGEAVHKHFNHRQFNAADKLGKNNAEEAAKAKKIIGEALQKAEAEKNAAGATYAELLKAGQMPGKN
jgi:hypothetical protein